MNSAIATQSAFAVSSSASKWPNALLRGTTPATEVVCDGGQQAVCTPIGAQALDADLRLRHRYLESLRVASQAAVLKRCLRWSKIIKDLYEFEHESEDDNCTDVEEEVDDVEVVLPSSKKEPSLKLPPPERKRKLSMHRFR